MIDLVVVEASRSGRWMSRYPDPGHVQPQRSSSKDYFLFIINISQYLRLFTTSFLVCGTGHTIEGGCIVLLVGNDICCA